MVCIPDGPLFTHQLKPKFLVEDVDCDANFPEPLLFLLNHLGPLVVEAACDNEAKVRRGRAAQVAAYKLLYRYGRE